jgi:hypothetical protein
MPNNLAGNKPKFLHVRMEELGMILCQRHRPLEFALSLTTSLVPLVFILYWAYYKIVKIVDFRTQNTQSRMCQRVIHWP